MTKPTISMITCAFDPNFDTGDIVSIIATIITLLTVILMAAGNRQNARQSRLQSIENTIIKQLEFHHGLVTRMKVNIEAVGGGFGSQSISPEITGSDTFEVYYGILRSAYSELSTFNLYDPMVSEEQRISDAYNKLYGMFGSQIGNYFKNLYLLYKYIDDKRNIKGFDRGYYLKLVKSQLSKFEILLLAYNCIWLQDKPRGKNFIDLAQSCKILTALETNELIQSENFSHKQIFEQKYHIKFG